MVSHSWLTKELSKLSPAWLADEQQWPKAGREYVFLLAAFQEVGRRLYGEAWTGQEAFPLQAPHEHARRQWEKAKQLSSLPPPPPTISNYRRGQVFPYEAPRKKIDPAEIARLAALHTERVETERAANEAMFKRRCGAAEWIADSARNGDLATYGIARHWQPRKLDPSLWFGSNDWMLFEVCETKRWVSQSAGVVTLQLFVGRDSLDRCLASLAPSAATASRARAELEAAAWLEDQFAKPGTATITKSEFREKASQLFQGLSGDAFKRAWGAASLKHPKRRNAGRKSTGQSVG